MATRLAPPQTAPHPRRKAEPTGVIASPLRRRQHEPGIKLDCGAGADVRHVGIVFVHGIGSQEAGETLLDWGGAMVRVLLDARVRHHASADPVIDVELDPGPGDSRFIEVQLPPIEVDGETVPEQHWVMTEAWWAQRVRPPSFGQMADWLGSGGAIRRIVDALVSRKHGVHDPRLRPSIQVHPLRRTGEDVEEAAERGAPEHVPGPSGTRVGRALAVFGGNLYLQAVSALLLVLYGLLRTIEKLVPIGPLKDGALTRPLDNFVLDWFGDVYVLLADSAQSASVRGRLVDSLEDLEAAECDEIAIVAHSGGAIVSYLTLADPTRRFHVDRVVTLGEGLNLAWHLIQGQEPRAAEEAEVQYDRLYRDVLAAYPDLRWDDFWGSQDPAPVGVLEFPRTAAPGEPDLGRVHSHGTWNRLSFADDHGSYWENDEEFLIPLLRLLEDRPGSATLFGDEHADAHRSNSRRRRLSVLSLLRQSSFSAPTVGLVIGFALGTHAASRVSDAIAAIWSRIPGSGVVSDPLNYARGLRLEDTGAIRFAAESGVWLVALAIAASAAFSLLSPPERPLPFARGGRLSRTLGFGLRLAPYIAGVPALAAIVFAVAKYVSGATPSAIDIGIRLLAGIVVVALLVAGLRVVLGEATQAKGWRYGSYALLISGFMVVACLLVVAPVVAAVVYPDVGRTVLGAVGIVVAFQALGRVGAWRWGVWDARERAAARTGRAYAGLGRVAGQTLLIALIFAAAFAAVILDSPAVAAASAIGVVALVLVGVSIDVLDAVRQERTSPADTIRRYQFRG